VTKQFFIFPRKQALFAPGRRRFFFQTRKMIFVFFGSFITASLEPLALGKAF
jgi:hypothetical protein